MFFTGILFATSSSKHLALLLQPVIQANGAPSSFGKYTLYSAYAMTANGNMSPLAFGLLFGNEDTKNWSKFWRYVKKIHPCIDSPEVTILTDQDKGSIAAVEKEAKPQFFCSFHRHQNIIKTLGFSIFDGKTHCALNCGTLLRCVLETTKRETTLEVIQ